MGKSNSSSESKSRTSASAHKTKSKRTRPPPENHSPNFSPEKKKQATGSATEDCASSVSSSQQTYRRPPPVNYEPEFTTPNPFDPLSQQDDDEEDITDPPQDELQTQNKPPVINIKNVTNFLNICKSISSVVGEQAFTCKARIDVLSIQANNSDNYRKIIKHLQAIGMEHYTYQFREEKAYRVVIRHLHPTTPVELIKSELEKIGFSVIDACNVLQRSTRLPLPLFFVNLKPAENNGDIFTLKTLLYTAIKVEEPNKKEDLPQCTRCQGYNHTRKYCSVNPVCVKCAGPHLTHTCAKTRDTPATCANCQQSHPANYRGCSFYKDLVARLRSKSEQQSADRPQPAAGQQPAPTNPGPSSLGRALPQREVPPPRPPTTSVGARPSYASAVKSIPLHSNPPSQPQPSPNPPHLPSRVFIPPPNPSSDLTTLTTSLNNLNLLINNLQALISPLTELLQKVTSILSLLQP